VTSYQKPSPGVYVFRYSLTPHAGDWRQAQAWQQGAAVNTPLIAVGVTDEISSKSMPPAQSLVGLDAENLVVSTVKRAEHDDSLVVRFFETAGMAAQTGVTFLGRRSPFVETNMLEENLRPAENRIAIQPYEIKTIKLPAVRRAEK
jgi:alpha-mannosidase